MAGAFRTTNGHGMGGGGAPRASRDLSIEVVEDRGGSWVAVSGELDIANASRLRDALTEALGASSEGRLTVDLSAVWFMDARGLHELLDLAGLCETAQIALRILAPQPVRRVCVLAGVADRLPID